MKNIIQLILYICMASLYSTAQVVCPDIPNNTTDPNNPQHYSTDPAIHDTYINLRTDGSPKLDWMQLQYEWWTEGTLNTPPDNCFVDNPYWTTSNDDNMDDIFSTNPLLHDNKPEDGWELIVFNFGIRIDTEQVKNISHPYIILYNKHRGILRVFYYLIETEFEHDYDLVNLKLQFENEEDMQSANLNHMEEVARPISTYRKDQNEQRSNQLNNAMSNNINNNWCTGMWLFADFVMAYDPCVCNDYKYDKLEVSVVAINSASISLTGDIITNEATKVDNGTLNGDAKTTGDFKTGYKTVNSAAKEAKTYYKSGGDWVGFAAGIAGKLPPKKTEHIELTKLTKGIPYLGAAIGVVNFFLFQEEKESEPASQAVSFNATVNISGSIDDSATTEKVIFHVPGSKYGIDDASTKPNEVPLYDEPLGVVSLVKTPRIEYKHNVAGQFDEPSGGFIGNHVDWEQLPMVTTYTVKDAPEIAVNPSSGLDLVEAKISNVLEYVPYEKLKEHQNRLDMAWQPDYGFYARQFLNFPYVPGASLNITTIRHQIPLSGPPPNTLFAEVYGWNHDNWLLADNARTNLELQDFEEMYKISYGQMPLGCYEGSKFNLISNTWKDNGNDNWVWEKPKVVVRLNLTLKRPHADPTKGDVYYKIVQSYLIDPEFITEENGPYGHYSFDSNLESEIIEFEPQIEVRSEGKITFNAVVGGGAASWANNYTNSPGAADFLVFEDEQIGPGRIEAWDKIIIRDNVSILPGTELIAGSEIIVRPENTFYPEVAMKIGRSVETEECASVPIDNYLASGTDLDDFCDEIGVQKYNPVSTKRDFITNEEQEKEENSKAYDFNLYPNPTNDLVNIEIELIPMAVYTIDILDLSGRQVISQTMPAEEFYNSTTSINTTSLESGIYFVNVREGTNTMTKRLVIAR